MGWEQIEQSGRLLARAKHDLANKNPSLANQAKFYREQSEDRKQSKRDRRLWVLLAEEMEARIEATRPVTTEELIETNESLF